MSNSMNGLRTRGVTTLGTHHSGTGMRRALTTLGITYTSRGMGLVPCVLSTIHTCTARNRVYNIVERMFNRCRPRATLWFMGSAGVQEWAVVTGIGILITGPNLSNRSHNTGIMTHTLHSTNFRIVCANVHLAPRRVTRTTLRSSMGIITLSLLSNTRGALFPGMIRLLGRGNVASILIVNNNIVPSTSVPNLGTTNVTRMFAPNAPADGVISFVGTGMGWFCPLGRTKFIPTYLVGCSLSGGGTI